MLKVVWHTLVVLVAVTAAMNDNLAFAQRVRLYYGNQPATYGVWGHQPYGHYVGPYGYNTAISIGPGHYHGAGMSTPYPYYSGYGSHFGIGGYGPVYSMPPVVVAPPIYGTTTTIIRGGPSGGVVEYSNGGNGYTYTPGSTYPTVVTQTPTLGLPRTNVIDAPVPSIVESRPTTSAATRRSGISQESPIKTSKGTIKLTCPKTSPDGLTYSLNGIPYSIKPGYSQTFEEDRIWTIEFSRTSEDTEKVTHQLRAGTYVFVAGSNGWELQQPGTIPALSTELPPPPLPPAPEPAP